MILTILDDEIKDLILEYTFLHSTKENLILDDWYIIEEKNNQPLIKRFLHHHEENDYYQRCHQKKNKILLEKDVGFKAGPGSYQVDNVTVKISLSTKIYNTPHLLEKYRDVIIEGDSLDDIKKFIAKVQQYSMVDKEEKIQIFSPSPKGYWECICKNPKRPIETVFINEKDYIINDLEEFMKNESDYEKYGIPYKRNYLFYGPPGNGKTSFINAIAAKYNFKIFLLSISQITDEMFKKLISSIKDDGLLVLEDVDNLFNNDKKNLTMSTVLNVLDGLARQNRIICIMTTNHFEVLTSVFKRPGRLDCLIEFKNADEKCFIQMISHIKNDDSLNERASNFFKKIEHLNPSRAIIQKFLFENRHTDCLTNDMIKKFKDLHKDYEEIKEKINLYN